MLTSTAFASPIAILLLNPVAGYGIFVHLSLIAAFVYFLTSDGAGRGAFAAIVRPNWEALTGTASMMSSGTL
jgi:hypothetical protein